MSRTRLALTLFSIPIAVVAAGYALTAIAAPAPRHTARQTSNKCIAIDGDTLTCIYRRQRLHLRLNGIDAPELAGHCRAGRICAPGDAIASKENLARMIAGKRVAWRSLGTDRYGRTIAQPTVGRLDLGCEQMKGGFAIYKPKWDNRRGEKACATSIAR